MLSIGEFSNICKVSAKTHHRPKMNRIILRKFIIL